MRRYRVIIDIDALQDIQDATDWYEYRVEGLGSRFQKQIKLQIRKLELNPKIYRVRYLDVRCMIVQKFPFLVHFIIDEKNRYVQIFAVIHTSKNPKIWIVKRG